MGAVWLLSSGEVRRRARNLIAITMLIAIVGVIVMATAAGARRSATALSRFDEYSRTSTLEMSVGLPPVAKLEAFARTPGIEAIARLHVYGLSPRFNNNQEVAAADDATIGTVVDRPRLVSGRLANLQSPNEITVGEPLAARAHFRVGSEVEVDSLTPAQVDGLAQGKPPTGVRGPLLHLTVVGIVRRPLDLGDLGVSGGVIILTPAFERTYAGSIGVFSEILRVRTRPDATTIQHVTEVGQATFGASSVYSAKNLSLESHGASDAINVITLALWIFAGVAALAGSVASAIVLSREVANITPTQSTLRALGLTPAQRGLVAAPGAAVVAIAGTALAMLGAVLVSPFLPVGIARRADPNPGLHADWFVLGLGALAIFVVVAVVTAIATMRATRAGARDAAGGARHSRPTVAESAARAGCPPAFVNGLRMALQPGRGERAVPMRSAFVATALGVLGITAVLVFSASLSHVVATPRHYGWTFEFKVFDAQANACDANDEGVGRVAGTADLSGLCFQTVQASGRAVNVFSFTPIRGSIGPEIVTGHAPAAADQIALGSATIDGLRKHVGDSVTLVFGSTSRTFHIVGVGTFPRLTTGDLEPVADGAYTTNAGFRPLLDSHNINRYIVGRFSPGTDRARVENTINGLAALHPDIGQQVFFGDTTVAGPSVPPEIDRLRHVGWFPPALIALLAVLATIAVGHALITSVRRRRTDLALLKTLGFQRRQLRATIAYEASTIVLVGCAIGVPAGLVVGRFAWRLAAEGLGIAPGATYPALLIALCVLTGLVVVNVLGFFPAEAAARTRVAETLRSE
jgi:FtsX-like permease family